jgi:hypothetical protein
MVTANVAVRGNTVNKVILLGIASSRTRKPPEEWFSPRNHKFIYKESTEDCNSVGNHQLMDADSGRQDQNVRKIL